MPLINPSGSFTLFLLPFSLIILFPTMLNKISHPSFQIFSLVLFCWIYQIWLVKTNQCLQHSRFLLASFSPPLELEEGTLYYINCNLQPFWLWNCESTRSGRLVHQGQRRLKVIQLLQALVSSISPYDFKI